jgi:hypothetical protein
VIFDTIKTYAATGLAIALVGALAWGGIQTYRIRGIELKATQELKKATDAARIKEQNWQSDAATADEVHDEELNRIHDQHLRDLERLRDRAPKRLPATPKSCAGASPAALSAPDAAVVVGWGAEFDSLRAEYIKCKSAVERF